MKKYFSEYPNFFNEELRPKNLDEILKKLESFIENENIVLITSGGTRVPLEKVEIRSIDNFSTGRRGTLLCECFLKRNKKVIFLYRNGTMIPFEHHLKSITKMNNIDIVDDTISFNLNEEDKKVLLHNINNYKKYSKHIFLIPYDTVFEYGFYLIEICNLLNENLKKKYINYLKIIKKEEIFNCKSLNQLCSENFFNDMLLFFTHYNVDTNQYNINEQKLNELLEKLNLFQKISIEENDANNDGLQDIQIFFKYIYIIMNNIIQKKKYILQEKHIQSIIFKIHILMDIMNYTKHYATECQFLNESSNENIRKNKNFEENENKNQDSRNFSENENSKSDNTLKKNGRNKPTGLLNTSHLVVLCAAASDFYIPFNELHENKIESDKSLCLKMHLTPKFYRIINKYFPFLHLCIFKLENNENMLIKKSNNRIQYADIIIANLLTQRYNFVYFFDKNSNYFLLKKSNNEPIENKICNHICEHFNNMKNL